MLTRKTFSIFKNGSKTYFYSSLFFPKEVRDDVFILYSFVRVADDFVDSQPQRKKDFLAFRKEYQKALQKGFSSNEIINNFIQLMNKRKIEKVWVEAFLDAMQQDLTKKKYKNLQEVEEYMYGSAEVIGLMMAKILELPEESYFSARQLGKAMQFINFIRDITEDQSLNRNYFPQSDLRKYNLQTLSYTEVYKHPSQFKKFMLYQLMNYKSWQIDGEDGYQYIPSRYLIPIKTAADMYWWTAEQIARDPMIVFEKKVKPSIFQILFTILRNSLETFPHQAKQFSLWFIQ